MRCNAIKTGTLHKKKTLRPGQGAQAEAKNRSSGRPKDGLKGLSLRAGRGVQRSVCLRNEGTPRLEGQPFRTAVRWADIFGLELLHRFSFKRKAVNKKGCLSAAFLSFQ